MSLRVMILLVLVTVVVSGCVKEVAFVSLSRNAAVDSENNIHLVWSGKSEEFESDNNVYYRMWDGTEWSRVTVISDETSNNNMPIIFSDSPDNVYVVWKASAEDQVLYKHYNGTDWSRTIKLNNDTSWRFSADLDKQGILHVVWDEGRDIHYKKIYKTSVRDYRELLTDLAESEFLTELSESKIQKIRPYWVDIVTDSNDKAHILLTVTGRYSFSSSDLVEHVVENESYSTREIYGMDFYAFTARIDDNDEIYLVNLPHFEKNEVRYGKFGEQEIENNVVVTYGLSFSPVVNDSFGNLYFVKDVGNRNFIFDSGEKITNASLNIRYRGEWSADIPLTCEGGTILPVLAVSSSDTGSVMCLTEDKISFINIDYSDWSRTPKDPTRTCKSDEVYADYIDVNFDLVDSEEGLPEGWKTGQIADFTAPFDGFVKGRNVIHEWKNRFYDVHVNIFEFNSAENASKYYLSKVTDGWTEVHNVTPVRLEYPELRAENCVMYDYSMDENRSFFFSHCLRKNVFVEYNGYSFKGDNGFEFIANVIDAKLKECIPPKDVEH